MRNIILVCILLIVGGVLSSIAAQVVLEPDTTKQESEKIKSFLQQRNEDRQNRVIELPNETSYEMEEKGDSSIVVLGDSIIELKIVQDFKPNPTKAVIYSAIFPGLGQIYNRKYWKLPIIYGGFAGVTYAISWNGRMYSDYSRAYGDLMSDDDSRDSWKNFLANPNIDQAAREKLKPQFKRQKDVFRRNRDLAIIVGVGLYALCIIDAYVDAQLYDFDVSPDLSMTIAPVMFEPTLGTSRTFGVQCSFKF